MTRRKATPEEDGNPAQEPTFEDALAGLEAIVESMEHEHLSLEDLVTQYEKGSMLLTRCEAILQSARGRIELITLRNQNEIALEADAKTVEDREAPHTPGSPDDPDDDDHDIRLF